MRIRRGYGKKKRSSPGRAAAVTAARQAEKSLGRAEELLDQGRAHEARDILDELDRRSPNSPAVLALLTEAIYELKDFEAYPHTCERLLRLTPDDPTVALNLAAAYMINIHPAHALRAFRRFLQRWPDHPRADEARRTAADLEPTLARELAAIGLAGAEGEELGWLHEEAVILNSYGEYIRGLQAAEQLLQRRPDFVPALNNASLSAFSEGDLAQAIAYARRAIEADPHSVHAHANLAHYLFVRGETAEALEVAARLKALPVSTLDQYVKQAEALSYLGDDQGVLDVFAAVRRAGTLDPGDALFYDRQRAERLARCRPLLDRKQFHTSEFAAFCQAQIGLLVAEKEYGGAHQWLHLWESMDAGNPHQEYWRKRLEPFSIERLLGGWLNQER
ncbi:MAG TPA: tetratricopeptide repeat protein [Roseiflexaceae bacterium]|nr:tetratricopeptide repeat protein [Roseiflexaceae bacterium]